MSLDDFLRNRPAARGNPSPTPQENAQWVLDAQDEMEQGARFVSSELDPVRRDFAARLKSRLSDGDYAHRTRQWEALNSAGVVTDAWMDGTPRFVFDPLGGRIHNDPESLRSECRDGAYDMPPSFYGMHALAMASADAPTIEALWGEARGRLQRMGQGVGSPEPLWTWHEWQYPPTQSAGVSLATSMYRAINPLQNALRPLDPDEPGESMLTLTRPSATPRLEIVAGGVGLPWLRPLRSRKLSLRLAEGYDTVLVSAMAWELAVARDLKVPADANLECAGMRFADLQSPFLPLVEILRRGYGWVHCATPIPNTPRPDVTRRFVPRIALVAPHLLPLSRETLQRDGWFGPPPYTR